MPPITHNPPVSHAKYRIHFEDVRHSAATAFTKLPNLGTIIQDAVKQVFKHLYEIHGTPQAVRSVTLILETMDGVANTQGTALDDLHKEIRVSLQYIGHYTHDTPRFQSECTGVITHEMVHCWQHNCLGTAPGGLIEGIADFVRLKAGLAPPHWRKDTKSDLGSKWDEGYQKTAWFLEWLEDVHGKGTVGRINAYMDGRAYQEAKFWDALFKESVDSLWKKYLKHWDDEHAPKPPSIASTEPELVDLTEEEKAAAVAEAKAEAAEPKQQKHFQA